LNIIGGASANDIQMKEKAMLLTIDIGNTNLTLGIYKAEVATVSEILGPRWRLATVHDRMPDEYGLQFLGLLNHTGIRPADLTGVCMASVVPPLTSKVVEACRRYLDQDPLIVDAGVKTGVRIRYEDPRAVGADRIVDAAAVQHLYGGPACVVDFGTATTFDAISGEGEYLGGAIAPGIGIASEALFLHTAKLPRVDLQRPPAVIGRNTVHAMQSGLLFGYVSLVEGMVARFRKELGPSMKVIATGGLAEIIARETDILEIIAPWLTLDGLQLIWEMNL
jgi:type III pantothenate kinase